jgi:hypothetical protein
VFLELYLTHRLFCRFLFHFLLFGSRLAPTKLHGLHCFTFAFDGNVYIRFFLLWLLELHLLFLNVSADVGFEKVPPFIDVLNAGDKGVVYSISCVLESFEVLIYVLDGKFEVEVEKS